MPAPVVDTMVLQAFLFGHPEGGEILLQGLGVDEVRFPSEIYRFDEDDLLLTAPDDGLSEFARGIRYAKRKTLHAPAEEAQRYVAWLTHLKQLPPLREAGRFRLDPLELSELPRRIDLEDRFGIGAGEAAGIVLATRSQDAFAVFASSDDAACRIAEAMGIAVETIPRILIEWAQRARPSEAAIDRVIDGLAAARFALSQIDRRHVRQAAR